MRFVALVLALSLLPLLAALATTSCESSSSPSGSDAGGTIVPTADGAVCGCASPDCLPNCSDLPSCKVVCENGETIIWVDPCGKTQYAEACANGCVDAASPKCQ
jgi:hypothetical protein